MSKVERKEYKETKIMRTHSPSVGRLKNPKEFDNSLDYLLEDLQSTVSRPSSSLTNGTTTYRETSRTSNGLESSKDSLKNRYITTNPVQEYSTNDSYTYLDPDGSRHFKTVSKEAYSYKATDGIPEKLRMQNNINQLDSLLDDLQQVKQAGNNNNLALESGYHQQYKSKVTSGKTVEDVPTYKHRTRSADRSARDEIVTRDVYHHNEGTYGDLKSVRTTTPSPTRSNSSTLTKQTRVANVQQYPVEVIQTTTPDINPEILASLDPELLPSGNTKVTTTIKTYTYEIPGNGTPIDTEKYAYSPNQSATTPSKSFVYNKYENNSLTRNYQNGSPSFQSSSPTYVPSSPGSDRKVIRETVTTRNYQPNNVYHQEPGKHTYIYNENTSTKKYVDYPEHQYRTPQNNTDMYVTKETHTTSTSNRESPDRAHLPPVTTTIQRFDSMSNLNARQYPETESFDPRNPPYQRPVTPPEVNVTYKYRSTSNTTNNYRTGYAPEDEPLIPRKFPVDEIEGPPRKLDDLMAKIGNEPPNNQYNVGFEQHERDMAQRRKIGRLQSEKEFEQQQKDRKEAPKTANITGPPVYYPPGHELFAKKEEAGAWRAEGAMGKEKGKYKYEAESKSKSKSSSGAAIVPVCLPLCCGLPCTIL